MRCFLVEVTTFSSSWSYESRSSTNCLLYLGGAPLLGNVEAGPVADGPVDDGLGPALHMSPAPPTSCLFAGGLGGGGTPPGDGCRTGPDGVAICLLVLPFGWTSAGPADWGSTFLVPGKKIDYPRSIIVLRLRKLTKTNIS